MSDPSPRLVSEIRKGIRYELRWLLYTKLWMLLLGTAIIGAGVAASGSNTGAVSKLDRLSERVSEAQAEGFPVEELLTAPTRVTETGDSRQVDNPFRFYYDEVREAFAAMDPTTFIGTGLELSTFVIFPLFLVYASALLATHDSSAGMVRLRSSQQKWSHINVVKALCVPILALVVVVVAVPVNMATAALTNAFFPLPVDQLQTFPDLPAAAGTPIWHQLLAAWALLSSFGLAAYALASATRSLVVTVVSLFMVLLVLPIVSGMDPRNYMAGIGQSAFNFWGDFEVRAFEPVATVEGAGGLLAYVAVFCVIIVVAGQLRSRRE